MTSVAAAAVHNARFDQQMAAGSVGAARAQQTAALTRRNVFAEEASQAAAAASGMRAEAATIRGGVVDVWA
jgi:hypothetical protein